MMKSSETVHDEDDKSAMVIDEALIALDTTDTRPGNVAQETVSSDSDSELSEPEQVGVRRTGRKAGKVNYALAPLVVPKPKARKSVTKKASAKKDEPADSMPSASGSKSHGGQKRSRASK